MKNITQTLRRLSAIGGAAAVAMHVARPGMKVEPAAERRSEELAAQPTPETRGRTYTPSSSVGFPVPTMLNPIKDNVDAMGAAAFDAFPNATQLAVALTAATHENAKALISPRRTDLPARRAEAVAGMPYKRLEELHPGLSHKVTLERAGGRTPQYYLTHEQFVKLAQHNPIVAWIAKNARFLKAGTCHGEAFAQVRRMAGLPSDAALLKLESIHPIAKDFQQISPDSIPTALAEGGVVVLNGTGQLVAEDSSQRVVESGAVEPLLLWNLGRIKESEGAVNHSVMLIDHPNSDGLVPEGYVIVYDPDPFCKRFANLHDPRWGPSNGSVVPEADVHKLLRIVHLRDLIAETQQQTYMPKAMRPLFPLHFPPPEHQSPT